MLSGSVFHCVVAFTNIADCPKAVRRKGAEQSLVEDILVDFMDYGFGGAKPFIHKTHI